MQNRIIVLSLLALSATAVGAQSEQGVVPTDSMKPVEDQTLNEVVVMRRRPGTARMLGALNGSEMNKEQLFKAACCNLGESFTGNPSVDVNFNDATTGAKQIKLLGLAGTYVQLLTENQPNFRGAAAPYALDYIPGTWMKSIQVSKGSASVKNGYESLTGQINVQYLQPEDAEGVTVNLYGNTMSRLEANAEGNIHVNKKLSTELLTHFHNSWDHHDINDDGFLDEPNVRQYNFQNRWLYKDDAYIFHGGLSLLNEERMGGQRTHHAGMSGTPFLTDISTRRYEAYMKHAVVLDKAHGSNLALMANASMHLQDALLGAKAYRVNEKSLSSQLVYETNFTPEHNLSLGLSFTHDYLGQGLRFDAHMVPQGSSVLAPQIGASALKEKENVVGAYAQYTYNLHERLVAMAGIRVDHSSLYGSFVTPRLNLKWQVNDILGLRASVGKGYRAARALAENSYLLGSGRQFILGQNDHQEEAWNYGVSAALNIPLWNKNLQVNADYYFTNFIHQTMVDFDADPHQINIYSSDAKSYSHALQIDASYELLRGMTMMLAYRRNIVKATYHGVLMDKPLTSKYKGLATLSYKTPLGIWQFDATLQLNGGGRMPEPYTMPDGKPSWNRTFGAYPQLNAQVTRWFRHFSVYIGGENLTGYRQKNPVIGYADPWSSNFDTAMVWGPSRGAMGYVGIRFNIGKL